MSKQKRGRVTPRGTRSERRPPVIFHPDAAPDGEPLLVPSDGTLVAVRGIDAIKAAQVRGDETFGSNIVTGYQAGEDGKKVMPSPDEVIEILASGEEPPEWRHDPTTPDTYSFNRLRLPSMSLREAREWITGGVDRGPDLSRDEKVMYSIHAFNTAGYLNASGQAETLSRIAVKFRRSREEVFALFAKYAEEFPIQQETPVLDDFRLERLDALGRAAATLSAKDQAYYERLRDRINTKEFADTLLENYRSGRFRMIDEDGNEVDGSNLTEIKVIAPDGPIRPETNIQIRATTGDGKVIEPVGGREGSEQQREALAQLVDAMATEDIVDMAKSVMDLQGRVRYGLAVPQFTCGFQGCGLRLNRVQRPGREHLGTQGYEWVHGRAMLVGGIPRHTPVIVPEEHLPARMVCDFCTSLDPVWFLGCSNYTHTLSVAAFDINTMDGCWAACQSCKDLLDAGEGDQIASAVAAKLGGLAGTEGFLDEIRAMHHQFVSHRNFDDRLIEVERATG